MAPSLAKKTSAFFKTDASTLKTKKSLPTREYINQFARLGFHSQRFRCMRSQ